MRIFGNNIGIVIGDSASLATGSISLNENIPGISFIYTDPNYATGSGLNTESIASIDIRLISASNEGPLGELVFSLKTPSNLSDSGSTIIRTFYSGSNNEPRFGLGFDLTEPILTSFDVKTKKDSSEGTELFLRSSRTDKGAIVGDTAGSIYFLIDSGSYNTGSKNEFIQSGSIASIDAVVTEINTEGAQGNLRINTARTNTDATRALWTMGYGADPRVGGNFGSITTGSLNIVRPNLAIDDMLTLTNYNGDYISLMYYSSSFTTDALTTVDTFNTGSYTGVIYDYTLSRTSTGARTGQIMAVWDVGEIEITDVSTRALGDGGIPTFTATISGTPSQFSLQIERGSGYTFKSFVKRI